LNGATAPAGISTAVPYQVSRNGRFLASGTTVVDLTTGTATQVSPGDVAAGGGLGNNGGLLTLTLLWFANIRFSGNGLTFIAM
jgi:hypothetical protein